MHALKIPGFVDVLQRANPAFVDPTIRVVAEGDMNVSRGSTMTDGNVEGLICKVVPVNKARFLTEPVVGKSRLVSRFQV